MDIRFDEYKKNLENLIQEVNFIYSGDTIRSEHETISMELNHGSISSKMIRQTIIDIYNWSFNQMILRSEEVRVNKDESFKIESIVEKIQSDVSFLFHSNNAPKIESLNVYNNKSYLPESFYRKGYLPFTKSSVSIYFSDNIIDDPDDYHIYISNKPIQSMVWIIQNMEYKIKGNKHTIDYQLFHCDYKSYKIRIVDNKKIREKKIKSLLSDK
jgi:hypothetical protein